MSVGHEANWDRLCEFVTRVMEQKGVPGVAVGVLDEGEMATAGFGVTSVENPLDVTDETLFQIGSITKTFTGTAIMRLVERGELDLDATVRSYIPDFEVADETASARATIRHLLTHMGGWVGDLFDDTGPGDDALGKYVALVADLKQLAPFDTVWSYNNAGFSLAGYIIELMTEKPYEAALEELVLEPLGLENCYFDPTEVMTYRFAVGHNVTDEGAEVGRPWPLPRSAHPAGGITTHVKDLLTYARFHLGDGTVDGERVLASDSLAQMQTTQADKWRDETWGLTWSVDVVDGVKRISHGGGTLGQISLLSLIPEHDFAVAILTNANRGGDVTTDVTKWALQAYLGLEEEAPEPIESSEEELATYVGRYSRPFAEIELGMLAGRLVGQIVYKASALGPDAPPPPPPPPMALARCEEDRLVALDGPFQGQTADVIRKADGSIGWLRTGGRIHPRVEG